MAMTTSRRRSSLWALAAAASLGTAVGCSEPSAGPTTAEFTQAREAIANRGKAAKAAVTAKPAEVAGPTSKIDPASGVEQLDSTYTYDATGKRDPFRSFIWDRPDKMAAVADAGPLGQFDLSQLEVVAVVWRTGNARALVQDPSGETYIIGQGGAI